MSESIPTGKNSIFLFGRNPKIDQVKEKKKGGTKDQNDPSRSHVTHLLFLEIQTSLGDTLLHLEHF